MGISTFNFNNLQTLDIGMTEKQIKQFWKEEI